MSLPSSPSPSQLSADPSLAYMFCYENPDSPLCEDVPSYYEYRIDLAANVAFIALFGLSFVGFAVTWALTRRAAVFNIALLLGLVCEILGYAGRIMSHGNQWAETGFLMQICCLTIGPAFMAAGIYLCLRLIVAAFGPENSRIPPAYYTRIFIPCDVVSLVLQAVGGAMASISSHNGETPTTGTNIMIAGLSTQVVTILAFIAVSVDFALRARRRHRDLGDDAFLRDPALVNMRRTWRFRGFIAALALSAFCILWRSAFRVAELSEGWHGPIIAHQDLFIAFEGVLIVFAVAVLNVFHPAIGMREVFEASSRAAASAASAAGPSKQRFWSTKKSKGAAAATAGDDAADFVVDKTRHKSDRAQSTDDSEPVNE